MFEDIVPVTNRTLDADSDALADSLHERMDLNHDGVVVKAEFIETFIEASQQVRCACVHCMYVVSARACVVLCGTMAVIAPTVEVGAVVTLIGCALALCRCSTSSNITQKLMSKLEEAFESMEFVTEAGDGEGAGDAAPEAGGGGDAVPEAGGGGDAAPEAGGGGGDAVPESSG